MDDMRKPLLEVCGLKQYFRNDRNDIVKAVDNVSFRVFPGETYGLVGESGSGKSTIGRSVIRLYKPTFGKIIFKGDDISGKMTAAQEKQLRLGMQMIFQDPMSSLNPRKKVMDIVAQGLDIHHMTRSVKEREERVYSMLELVGLSRAHAFRYPFEFSGGQRQRIGIARALITNPDLVIADEAVSSLDAVIQVQIINLMKEIQQKMGMAIIFIAHDLSMVKYIADRVGVLHLGHLVETGTAQEVFQEPVHPYTLSLLSSIPRPNPRVERYRKPLFYDYASSLVDYQSGNQQLISGTHYVLGTEEEADRWRNSV